MTVTARSIDAGGVRWHVQVGGHGPTLLLLHGTGASGDSFVGMLPSLVQHFTVVVPDLPGHARSSTPSSAGMSVDGMGASIAALLRALDATPAVAVGHSAGAAIVARMMLDGHLAPQAWIGLNAALLPLDGLLRVMSPMAKLLARAPGFARVVSGVARDDRSVARLVDGTGSRLDAAGLRHYARLVRDRRHVDGALAMMAAWNLDRTWVELPRLRPPPLLVVGGNDRTIAPAQARRVAARLPGTKIFVMPGLGHLAHEEAPEATAEAILAHARDASKAVSKAVSPGRGEVVQTQTRMRTR